MQNNILILTGMMGAGKSITGKILSSILRWDFYDLDEEVEAFASKSISAIFEQEGEEKFRNIERQVLKKTLSFNPPFVLATGGGTLCNDEALELALDKGTVVYLNTNPEILSGRLMNTCRQNRPLLPGTSNKEQMAERLKKLLDKRINYYKKADICIDTNSLTTKQIADAIAVKIHQ